MTRKHAPPDDVLIAFVMICQVPRALGDRILLSASDAVWEPVVLLPSDIRARVTDDLGNPSPTYGGFLQLLDLSVLKEIESRNLFVCFRAVHQTFAHLVLTVPDVVLYPELRDELIHLGWDVCIGNGWVSASTEGYFPMDAISGKMEANEGLLNRWALFDSL